jgi:hypothetical protein
MNNLQIVPYEFRPGEVIAFCIPKDIRAEDYLAQPYVQKQLALLKTGKITQAEFQNLEIRHDDDCPLLQNTGLCACDPVVRLKTPSKGNGKGKAR